MARYEVGQRVGVALVRGSRDWDYDTVIEAVPAGASPYFQGKAAGESIYFTEREIVTTLPAGSDVESVEAWLNGR